MVNTRNAIKNNRTPEKYGVGVSAREKLTGALRTLMTQRDTEDPSTTSLTENSVKVESTSPHTNIMSLSSQNSSRINLSHQGNRSVEISSNRMQNNEENMLEEKCYLMRLYGRNINLGKFRHNTNLYPVCRDWVANQLQLSQYKIPDNVLDNNTCEEEQERNTKNYYKLPPPLPLDPGVLSLRVPSPSPVVKQGINLDYNSENALPSKQELLKGHLKHWTSVRKKWMHAYAEDEKRYYRSKRILKRMYDRTQAEF